MIEVKVIKGERGFSLTELVIVLAILAIALGFSIPMLSSSMRGWQLASDARNITTTLACAKLSATSQLTHCQLSFNLIGNEWRLNKFNKTTGVYDLQGSTNALSSGLANSGIAFKSSSNTAPPGFPMDSSASITFNSRGIPIDATGKPTANSIVFLSDTIDQYAVTVSLSGKVQLWRYRNGQ